MKLKSNREYWNELKLKVCSSSFLDYGDLTDGYDKQLQFTGQEPKLEMFVNLLEKPNIRNYQYLVSHPDGSTDIETYQEYFDLRDEYQQAEDKILFKGFGFESQDKDGFCLTLMYRGEEYVRCVFYGQTTLEAFVGCELTEQGIKQVGYENNRRVNRK